MDRRTRGLGPERAATTIHLKSWGAWLRDVGNVPEDWSSPPQSKVNHDSGRGLSGVGDCISVKRSQTEVGCVVNESPIFGPQRDMPEQREVRSATVGKHTDRLPLRSRNAAEAVPGGIKYERATFGEHLRADFKPSRCRHMNDEAAGCLMDIGLNSRKSCGREVMLGVPVVAIYRFRGNPAVQVVSVTDEKAAGVGASLGCALAGGVLGEKTCALQADLRAGFLSRGCDSEKESNAGEHNCDLPHT